MIHKPPSEKRYPHADVLGSVGTLTSASAAVTDRYAYEAFGTRTSTREVSAALSSRRAPTAEPAPTAVASFRHWSLERCASG